MTTGTCPDTSSSALQKEISAAWNESDRFKPLIDLVIEDRRHVLIHQDISTVFNDQIKSVLHLHMDQKNDVDEVIARKNPRGTEIEDILKESVTSVEQKRMKMHKPYFPVHGLSYWEIFKKTQIYAFWGRGQKTFFGARIRHWSC